MLNFKTLTTMLVLAGAIKVWQSGEDITSTDLNANFSHIHNKMVGGHGARLVDSDVNPAAAISTSKLAAYRQIPRAWGLLTCPMSASCVLTESANIASVSTVNTGANVQITVTLNYTATDINYAVIINNSNEPTDGGHTIYPVICSSEYTSFGKTVTQFRITCFNASSVQVEPQSISFSVYDDN